MPCTKTPPKEYVVKNGDTLSGISIRFLGKASRWKDIYNLNVSRIRSKDPNKLYPGEKLKIPPA